ncbi:hypothetical protein [Halalkalicoccus tibetensis]|uniref:Uncharacterized protein n=1 Tax=Halalkalicoccus tibetensis TaxID=175632 RepID=A0ABD5VAQ8_9EURY
MGKHRELLRQLERKQREARRELQNHPEVELFVDEHSTEGADPIDWLIDQIVSFSDTSWEEIEEHFGIQRDSSKIPVQNAISATQRCNVSGIFYHKPQPDWMQEYIDKKEETVEYFKHQREMLNDIRYQQQI